MLKILVLGFGGFIGKHLIDALSKENNVSVTVFGRSVSTDFNRSVRFLQGDFENADLLRKALENQDVVYHLISQTIPSSSWHNPALEVEKNLVPTLNLIESAAAAGVKKICFASSGGTVYGLQQDLLDEQSVTAPFSPYGIIKRATESFLQYAHLKSGIGYDIYRISNVYGAGRALGKGLGFINSALENIIANRPIVIYGDGENVRDYIYATDVADLLSLSVHKPLAEADIYNVSSGYSVSLNDLVEIMRNVLEIDFEVSYVHDRKSDNKRVILENSKIMEHFKNKNLVSLETGIQKTHAYLKKLS